MKVGFNSSLEVRLMTVLQCKFVTARDAHLPQWFLKCTAECKKYNWNQIQLKIPSRWLCLSHIYNSFHLSGIFCAVKPRSYRGLHSSFWLLIRHETEELWAAVPGCHGGRTQHGRSTQAWSPCACHCAGHSSGAFHLSKCDNGFGPHPANTQLNSRLCNKAQKVIQDNFSRSANKIYGKSHCLLCPCPEHSYCSLIFCSFESVWKHEVTPGCKICDVSWLCPQGEVLVFVSHILVNSRVRSHS